MFWFLFLFYFIRFGWINLSSSNAHTPACVWIFSSIYVFKVFAVVGCHLCGYGYTSLILFFSCFPHSVSFLEKINYFMDWRYTTGQYSSWSFVVLHVTTVTLSRCCYRTVPQLRCSHVECSYNKYTKHMRIFTNCENVRVRTNFFPSPHTCGTFHHMKLSNTQILCPKDNYKCTEKERDGQ